jgi:hypothetical protein
MDAERLQDSQHLRADGLIGAHPHGYEHIATAWSQRRKLVRANSPCRAAPLATAPPLPRRNYTSCARLGSATCARTPETGNSALISYSDLQPRRERW